MNVFDGLENSYRLLSKKEALEFLDKIYSFEDLYLKANGFASGLKKAGIEKGDRVGIVFANLPQIIISYFGTVKLGAIAVSLSPAFGQESFRYHINDSGPKILVVPQESLPNLPQQKDIPSVSQIITTETFDEFLATGREPAETFDSDGYDLCSILYTSGTTVKPGDKPKGVMLTHRNVIFNALSTVKYTGIQSSDRVVDCLPHHHVFAQNFILLPSISAGATLLLYPKFGFPNFESFFQSIQQKKATMFFGVPTFYNLILKDLENKARDYLSSVRYFFVAADKIEKDVKNNLESLLGKRLHQGFGLTESSPMASYYNPEEDPEKIHEDSVGRPIDGIQVKIIDKNGEELKEGLVGEICIRGPNIMKGYWQKPEITAEAIIDGWLRTGDLGYLKNGYLYFSVREKYIIKKGGSNINPYEISNVILQHPAVKEAIVIGVYSSTYGEQILAIVVLREGFAVSQDQLIRSCQEKLEKYKIPSGAVFVESLPKTPAGKPLVVYLKDQYWNYFEK